MSQHCTYENFQYLEPLLKKRPLVLGHLRDDVFLLLRPDLIFFSLIFKIGNPSEVLFKKKNLICTTKQNREGSGSCSIMTPSCNGFF